ncbi:hypothetical protein [Methanofollis fontis]|uniref:Uncharacterized protein n=1 Tax=Methanofollis fontis TaxID=2052832 RepID=A0A483CR46_9EURY|nr:hypothetical protein [Methanofollis fontis]TAJ43539.1 hypothetical protein CUJ86_10420 [Methanofollis fontis]
MRPALRRLLILCGVCLAVSALFCALFPLVLDGSLDYLVAYPCTVPADPSVPVIVLDEDDFREHPALRELVVGMKMVRCPSLFAPFLPPGEGWSSVVLTEAEEEALWGYMLAVNERGTLVPAVVEYNGTCYQVAASRGRPPAPSGTFIPSTPV